mmetsp:Transcript_5014/g.10097  ORF Transcript_5014/g.10097 Transcript_5014/m.10097 type:complete len:275 (+) Transcript_5014:54-878(+)
MTSERQWKVQLLVASTFQGAGAFVAERVVGLTPPPIPTPLVLHHVQAFARSAILVVVEAQFSRGARNISPGRPGHLDSVNVVNLHLQRPCQPLRPHGIQQVPWLLACHGARVGQVVAVFLGLIIPELTPHLDSPNTAGQAVEILPDAKASLRPSVEVLVDVGVSQPLCPALRLEEAMVLHPALHVESPLLAYFPEEEWHHSDLCRFWKIRYGLIRPGRVGFLYIEKNLVDALSKVEADPLPQPRHGLLRLPKEHGAQGNAGAWFHEGALRDRDV